MPLQKSRVFLFLSCFLGFVAVAWILSSPPVWKLGDFSHYWCSAKLLASGQLPYGLDLSKAAIGEPFDWSGKFTIHFASNPPPLIFVLIPLALFSPAVSWWIWILLGSLVFALAISFLPRFLEGVAAPNQLRPFTWWAPVLLVFSFPVWDWIRHSQITAVLVGLMALGCWCLKTGQEFRGGFFCGVATGLKIYPWPSFFFLLGAKKFKAVAGFVAGFLCIVILPAIFFTPGIYSSWIHQGLSIISGAEKTFTNNGSLSGLFYKVENFFQTDASSWQWERLVPSFLVMALAIQLGYRARKDRFLAGCFALAVSWSVFCSPVAWPHYACHHLFTILVFFYSGNQKWASFFWLSTCSLFVYFLIPPLGSNVFFLLSGLTTFFFLAWMTWSIGRGAEMMHRQAD